MIRSKCAFAYRKGQFSCTICYCWLCWHFLLLLLLLFRLFGIMVAVVCGSCCGRLWFGSNATLSRHFVQNSSECAHIVAHIFDFIFLQLNPLRYIALDAIECYLFSNAETSNDFVIYDCLWLFHCFDVRSVFLQCMHRLHAVVRLDTDT